jgi:hypothetical protein
MNPTPEADKPWMTVILHRYTGPQDMYGVHELVPDEGWLLRPFGPSHTSYSNTAQLVTSAQAENWRHTLAQYGYRKLAWFSIPEPLRTFLIHQVVPLEWKIGLRANHPSLTNKISLWIKGEMPG